MINGSFKVDFVYTEIEKPTKDPLEPIETETTQTGNKAQTLEPNYETIQCDHW